MTVTLPPAIRGAGFALVYAVPAAVLGGSTQLVVTWLLHVTGDPMAPAWYVLAATAVAQLVVLAMHESGPRFAKSANIIPSAAPAGS